MDEKSRILKKISNDKSRPVAFADSFGGSESQLRFLLKYLPNKSFEDINLILNSTDEELIEKDKINILWMHHYINQKEAQNLASKEFIQKLDYVVFNSNWNSKQHIHHFKIPESKSIVIRNAIEKIDFKKKPKDNINLIYHTTPWRGLTHLLRVFENLNMKNVILNVCSSTKIYGKKFDDILGKKYEDIFNKCKNTKNVNYLGFVNNKEIIELLKKSHIFAHPSIWPETSCVSAIESMAAGCQIVTTNLGALYETCSPFANFVNFDSNLNNLEKRYSKALKDAVNNYWSDKNQSILKLQSETINATYSWDVRSKEWSNFFDEIRSSKD